MSARKRFRIMLVEVTILDDQPILNYVYIQRKSDFSRLAKYQDNTIFLKLKTTTMIVARAANALS